MSRHVLPKHGQMVVVVAVVTVITTVMAFDWVAHPRTEWVVDTLSTTSPVVVLAGETERLHASFVRAGVLYGVEDHFVYASRDSGATFQQIGVIPKVDPTLLERVKNFVARRGLTRLLRERLGAVNMVVLSTGTVLVFYDRFYRMEEGGGEFEPVPAPTVADVFVGGVATGPGDTVYLGEYSTGERPSAPKVLRGTRDGQSWEVAYTFPEGAVYHVHSITYDPFRNGYWVATGDRGAEAGLWFTGDDFRTLEHRGGEGQDWRTVGLIVREHDLVWGSDDGLGSAGIYRWDLDSGDLHRLQATHNPSYFAGRLSDGTLVVTTTYEPDAPRAEGTERHPYASVWVSRHGDAWTEVLRFHEEPADGPETRRPQIRLPAGDGSLPQLVVMPLWTDAHSLSTLIVRLHW